MPEATVSSLIRERVERVPLGDQVALRHRASPWLQVASFDELMEHEREIVTRIAHIRNGANLFMANPFRLLADIGVELSPEAIAEIHEHEPHLGTISDTGYDALLASRSTQRVRYHLHGLFRRGER